MAALRRGCLSLILGLGACSATAKDEAVRLDYFFSTGCPECERVRHEVFPVIAARHGGAVQVVAHDLAEPETIPLLLAYQERCGNTDNGRVAVVVDHTVFLSRYAMIARRLETEVEQALARRRRLDWRPPQPPGDVTGDAGTARVRRVAWDMTLPVVVLGGLLDGFNPCAVSTLIFFLSVLVVVRASRRTRLLVGLAFITASFAVYFGLGLGLLLALRRMSGFGALRRGIEVTLGIGLVALAVFSFRDAIRYRRSGRAEDVTLQLPGGIKRRLHALVRSRVGKGGPILGGLAVGAGVTVLESLCTGQGYVPVLAYLAREGAGGIRFWMLLTLYNLLFVLPLAVVFALFHHGLQIPGLIAWSRRNVVAVKVLLALFFAGLAVLLLWP